MINTKEQRIATIGTVLFCILFTLILLMVRFINDPTEEEEGVLVNFGDSEQGYGQVEPRPAVAQNIPTPPTPSEPTPAQESSPEPQQTGEEEVVNQDFEESAVINKKKKAEADAVAKAKAEADAKAKAEADAAAKAKAEADAKAKAEADAAAKAKAEADAKAATNARAANAFAAGRNANGGNTGEGNTTGNGNQGSPNGDINSTNRIGNGGGNGKNFDLKGRKYGSTPPKPDYKSKSEGDVVVEIQVDQDGNVVSASPGKAGTTTNDPVLIEAARSAALKTKFNSDHSAPLKQIGTITYKFRQE